MKRLMKIAVLLVVLAFTFSSCASSGTARKCNGKRAIQTPMGPM